MKLTSKNLKPLTQGDVLLKGFLGKKLCSKCKAQYHPEAFDTCWDCYSKSPARITQYAEGYASQKDYEESTDPDDKGVETLNESIIK